MTMLYAGEYDGEGRIGMICGSTQYEDCAQSLADAGFTSIVPVPSDRAGISHYAVAVGDAVMAIARPETGLPAAFSVPVGVEWSIQIMPAGTVVRIDGVEMGTLPDNGLVLEFPTAGVSIVEVEPPFPYLPAKCQVTVTA